MNTHPSSNEEHAPVPGRRDPEGRRRAMLNAATEIIVTRGTSALTHRAVATLAGVSLGSTTQYFSSIDELRESALAQLAEEIEADLIALEASLSGDVDIASVIAHDAHQFMQNQRAVNADIALLSIGTTDPQLRSLALMWTNRLIEILTAHIGAESATAIAIYLDGATIHAGLHEHPISVETMRRTFDALITPTPTSNELQ